MLLENERVVLGLLESPAGAHFLIPVSLASERGGGASTPSRTNFPEGDEPAEFVVSVGSSDDPLTLQVSKSEVDSLDGDVGTKLGDDPALGTGSFDVSGTTGWGSGVGPGLSSNDGLV
jgi:hypothetical protein